LLQIADSNFGMYQQDLAVCDAIAAVHEQYGWSRAPPIPVLPTWPQNRKGTRVLEGVAALEKGPRRVRPPPCRRLSSIPISRTAGTQFIRHAFRQQSPRTVLHGDGQQTAARRDPAKKQLKCRSELSGARSRDDRRLCLALSKASNPGSCRWPRIHDASDNCAPRAHKRHPKDGHPRLVLLHRDHDDACGCPLLHVTHRPAWRASARVSNESRSNARRASSPAAAGC
jgi:hypothetical protein